MGYASSTDAVRIKHGYDRAGNRLYREDPVAAANGKDFDELYTYDGVNQLKTFQRGNLNGSKDALVAASMTFDGGQAVNSQVGCAPRTISPEIRRHNTYFLPSG